MSKPIAVILSGCGFLDGVEINEAVLTLLSLEEEGIPYACFAPDIQQYNVINHLTGDEMPEKRNVLIESARIVRGNINPLLACNVDDFSALIVVGGYGVATNLSNFALKKEQYEINKEFFDVCNNFKKESKPVGYICIAPVLLCKIYDQGVIMTIGNDQSIIDLVTKLGAIHKLAAANEIVVDEKNKVVTTPGYMLAKSNYELKLGIHKLVKQLKEMI